MTHIGQEIALRSIRGFSTFFCQSQRLLGTQAFSYVGEYDHRPCILSKDMANRPLACGESRRVYFFLTEPANSDILCVAEMRRCKKCNLRYCLPRTRLRQPIQAIAACALLLAITVFLCDRAR